MAVGIQQGVSPFIQADISLPNRNAQTLRQPYRAAYTLAQNKSSESPPVPSSTALEGSAVACWAPITGGHGRQSGTWHSGDQRLGLRGSRFGVRGFRCFGLAASILRACRLGMSVVSLRHLHM